MAIDHILNSLGPDEFVRVRHIMIPLEAYPQTQATATLAEAMRAMEQARLDVHGRQSLPRIALVMDEHGELAGVVRRRDILRGLEPKWLVTKPLDRRLRLFDVDDHDVVADANLTSLSGDRFIEGLKERAQRPVREVMQPIRLTVNADDRLIKAIYEMVSENLAVVPVLDSDGCVVGVLRSADAFHTVAAVIL